MLDKQIHKHLDEQEKLEIEIEDDIDALMSVVNIKKIIDNPEEVLLAIVKEVADNIENNFAERSIDNGIDFAKDVIKTKADIKIEKTKDPKLNEDDFDGDNKRQD